MSNPFVSVCVLTGDEALLPALPGQPDAGVPILQRLLTSIAGRDLVDEIVLSWNGTKRDVLDTVVAGFKDAFTIKVVTRPWDGDFAAARNHSFEAASGEWIGYLDADDVIPLPLHPAVAASLKAAGVEAPKDGGTKPSNPQSFKDYLRALPGRWNCVHLPYHYLNDVDGLPIQRVPWHGRFWRWHTGWAWRRAVHEDAIPIGGNVAKPCFNAALPVLHYPAVSTSDRTKRNIEIMQKMKEAAGKEYERDFLLLYGLGSALADQGDSACVPYLQAAVEQSPTHADRFQTLLVMHQAEIRFQRYDRAVLAALMAVETEPTDPAGYFALAEGCYWRGEWDRCAYWYEQGRAKAPRVLGLHVDHPEKRELWPKAFAAVAYLKVGDFARAIELCQEVLAVKPKERSVQVTLWEAQKAAALAGVRAGLKAAVEWGVLVGEAGWAGEVLDKLPASLRDDREIARMRSSVLHRAPALDDLAKDDGIVERVTRGFSGRLLTQYADAGALNATLARLDGTEPVMVVAPGCAYGTEPVRQGITPTTMLNAGCRNRNLSELRIEKDSAGLPWTIARFDPGLRAAGRVTIYAPVYTETWGPTTPRERGIGASEESVVYLTEHLANLGWQVEVFAPLDQPNIYVRNLVRWRRLQEFDPWSPRDTLIVHRAPWIVQQEPTCKQLILWHQDAGYPEDIWGPKVIEKAAHVVPSAWMAKKLGIERFTVLPNAVPEEHFLARLLPSAPVRTAHRAIWASNPTRGLEHLLTLWPEVRAAVPDATLDIFYGWELITALGLEQMKELLAFRAAIEARVVELKDMGVTWRGRVGQDQLAREFVTAGVMAYTPVEFEEGACVSLLRAQAAGCIPVFVGTGALPETQPFQKYMIRTTWSTGGRSQFIKAVVDAMQGQIDRAALAEKIPTWEGTTAAWDKLLRAQVS